MRALVLWAEPGSANLGVRALAAGSAALLNNAWPGIDVRFQGYGAGDAPIKIGSSRTLARQYLTPESALNVWMRSFDVVMDTRAGDSFADIYGLDRLFLMSEMAQLARRATVPLVMAPQTIGPFGSRSGRLIGRHSLKHATKVMTRDYASAAYCRALGRGVDALATDVVFALPVPSTCKRRDVVVNVSGLLWSPNPHVDSAKYQQLLLAVCRTLIDRGRSLTLLPHVLSSPVADNDGPATQKFAKLLDESVEIIVPSTLTEVREILASSVLVLGSRMHACLNALSVGTPAIPLAYSRKFRPLFEDLRYNHTLDLRTTDLTASDVLWAVDNESLQADVLSLREIAEMKLEVANKVLASSL